MPFGDGSGPGGLGPRTGRGFGFCSGYDHPGYRMGRGFGRGRGFGFGRGFGRAWGPAGFWPGPYAMREYEEYGPEDPEQEKEALKSQITSLEKTIDRLKKRMNDLKSKT